MPKNLNLIPIRCNIQQRHSLSKEEFTMLNDKNICNYSTKAAMMLTALSLVELIVTFSGESCFLTGHYYDHLT